MKLNLPETTRVRLARQMMAAADGYDRNDYDGLRYAREIIRMGEALDAAKRDELGRLDLPVEVWNEIIERLALDSDELNDEQA